MMLSQNEIVDGTFSQLLQQFLKQIGIVFCLETNQNLYPVCVFLLQYPQSSHIVVQFLHGHADGGHIAVLKRLWHMVRKAQCGKSVGDCLFDIFPLTALCVVATGCVGMKIGGYHWSCSLLHACRLARYASSISPVKLTAAGPVI